MEKSIRLLVATVILAAGCSRSPVLTVRNRSGLTLSNVVVAGVGFSEQVGTLAPGGEHRMRVRPHGDSGVRVTMEVGSQRVDSGAQGYFEAAGGYRVTATIGTNLAVSVSGEPGRFW